MTITQKQPKKTAANKIRDSWNDFVYSFRDLKTQKTRTFFAVSGIAISIFLMQTVGVLTDSLSFSFLDSSATNTGASDYIITKNLDLGGSFNPYMEQDIIQEKLDNIDEISSIFPRLLLFMVADINNPGPTDNDNRTVTFYGLNTSGEHEGGLGKFKYANNDTYFDEDIPDGYCIVSPFIQETLHVDVGSTITLHYASFPVRTLEVLAIVEPEQKFTVLEIDTVVTNLEWVQVNYELENKVNYFQAMIKNRELVYDTRNIPGTINRMRKIGEEVQAVLGYDYTVNMLKLNDLEQSEMMNIAMSVAFIFISIISLLIAAILINSILTTAVEERIREFGVFRVLGARRAFSFKLVLNQGLLLSIIGSIIGIVLGTLFVQTILPILYNWLGLWTNPIPLVVLPSTILLSFITGVGITLVVTAIPATKAAKTKIVEAINPYRHKNTGWKIKKEGRINTRLISIGISMVVAGGLVFYLIPQLAISGDIFVVMIAFIGVQLAFLIGLTLVSLGFVPGLQRIILQIFRLFNKKTTPIVRTSLYRYRRRNTSTVLMFSMTFAFILFISTTLELMKTTQTYLIYSSSGSDVVVYSTDVRNQVDENLMYNISNMNGVSRVSGAYTDAIDITAIQLSLQETGINDLDFNTILGSTRYDAELADLIEYYEFDISMIGIDENYLGMMDTRLMEIDGQFGESNSDIVNKLFDNTSNNIIIARAMADFAQLKIGDNTRLTFTNRTDNNNTFHIVNATIVGISDGMPGFWQFREARITAFFLGGVMTSKENYLDWMDMEAMPNRPLSKIFIEPESLENDDLDALRNDIDRTYSEEDRKSVV
mgnify:CR=1 FL=1